MINCELDFHNNDMFPDKRKYICHHCGKKTVRTIGIDSSCFMKNKQDKWETGREMLCFGCGKKWTIEPLPEFNSDDIVII